MYDSAGIRVGNGAGFLQQRAAESAVPSSLAERTHMALPRPAVVMAATIDLSTVNGPSLHFINLANELSQLGHPVTVVVPRLRAQPAVPFDASVQQMYVGDARRLKLPGTLSVVAIQRALCRVQADVLYLRASPATAVLAFTATRRRRFRLVVEYNGWLADEVAALGYPAWTRHLTNWLQVAEAHCADRIRCVTSGLKHVLIGHGIPEERIAVVGNGTSTSLFRPLDKSACRASLGIQGDEPVLVFVGNLWPAVDLSTLFSALALLQVRGRAARLVIVGDGADRARLEREAKTLLPVDTVRFLGSQSPQSANIAIGAADLGVAPFLRARNERIGLSPLKIRDYAAAGRPVVASALGGIDNLTGQSWLFLAEPESPQAMASALEHCLGSDLAILGREARAYAEENFSWGRVAEAVSFLVCSPACA